jgi:hypothetical protein
MELSPDWEEAITDMFDNRIQEKTDLMLQNAAQYILCLNTVEHEFFKTTFSVPASRSACFEYLTNQRWRKFLLSVYYADLLSYTKKEDQVDFSRLYYIVNKFPQGFTVWWIRAGGAVFPVGYTGWYYVEASTFNYIAQMEYNKDIIITNRFFLPAAAGTPYLYLFNYSIAPLLAHTGYSRTLIKDYAFVLSNIPCKGLFCAAVSDDGVRVAEQFGMKPIGNIKNTECSKGDRIYFLRKKGP